MTTDTTTAHLLKTFHPAPPNAYNGTWEHALTGVGTDAVLVSPHFDLDHLDELAGSPLIHTLYRALKMNEMLPRHFNAEREIEGEPWYDALPMIDALNVTLYVNGAEIDYDEAEDLFESNEATAIRPERIVMRLGMSAHGMPQPPVVIETDVVLFPNPDSRYDPYGIHAVVSAGSTIEPSALAGTSSAGRSSCSTMRSSHRTNASATPTWSPPSSSRHTSSRTPLARRTPSSSGAPTLTSDISCQSGWRSRSA